MEELSDSRFQVALALPPSAASQVLRLLADAVHHFTQCLQARREALEETNSSKRSQLVSKMRSDHAGFVEIAYEIVAETTTALYEVKDDAVSKDTRPRELAELLRRSGVQGIPFGTSGRNTPCLFAVWEIQLMLEYEAARMWMNGEEPLAIDLRSTAKYFAEHSDVIVSETKVITLSLSSDRCSQFFCVYGLFRSDHAHEQFTMDSLPHLREHSRTAWTPPFVPTLISSD